MFTNCPVFSDHKWSVDMISCPSCKSQNIDEAKFCGGCGTPLSKAAPAQSSALITCAQGHVYSSVYGSCPYCPQPNRTAPQDFATKIEPAPETIIEPMATRVEPIDTIVQPVVKVAPATVIEPVQMESRADPGSSVPQTGQIRRDFSTVIEPIGQSRPTVVDAPATIVESRPTVIEPVNDSTPRPATIPAVPPPRVTPVTPPPVAAPVVPAAPPVAVPPLPPMSAQQAASGKTERRTVVVPSDTNVSKGKLIGWLVSYSVHADGVDFRLRAARNVIGAHPSCDIVISDDAVSGVHASIVWRNGRCYLKDELSSNGTYLNDQEVAEPIELQNYDEVRIGNMLLIFVSAERTA
jgi:hypothetical protein